MNRHIINISEGMGYAKPMVTRFSSGFDTVAFVIDTKEDISHCAFALAVSAGGDCFMLTEDGEALVRGEENQKLCVEWSIGREITAKDGIVIYQLIAYTGDENGNNESIWYSPEGRLVVGESIELTEYEAAQIGSQPSVVMQILSKMHNCEANIEKLEKDAQAHASAKILDHPDKSVTPEKLSDSLAEILNGAATKDYVTSQTNPLSERLDEAENKDVVFDGKISELERGFESVCGTLDKALEYGEDGIRRLDVLETKAEDIDNRVEKCENNIDTTLIFDSCEGDDIKIDGTSVQKLGLISVFGKSVYEIDEEFVFSPDNPADIKHIDIGQKIGIDVKTKNLFDVDKFVELIGIYCPTVERVVTDGRNCIKFEADDLFRKDFSAAFKFNKNKQYTFSMDIKFAEKMTGRDDDYVCKFYIGFLYGDEKPEEANITQTPAGMAISNRRAGAYKSALTKSFGRVSVTSTNAVPLAGIGFSYSDRGYWYIDLDSIQIEEGSEFTGYTPYHCNSDTVTVPVALRGVPVTSHGNYTDSSGTQWIADEINFDEGYYIRRVQEFYPGDIYNIMDYGTTDDGRTIFFGEGWVDGEFECLPYGGLCNIAKNNHIHNIKNGDWVFSLFNSSDDLCTYTIYGPADSESDFEEKAKKAVYLLPLITPEKIIIDSADDIVLPKLYTYKPSTCITNNEGAYMTFSYVANSQKYIDDRLERLTQELATLQKHIIK